MKIVDVDNPKLIEITIDVLNQGGLVIYPTETCYGVGVDATNPAAVSRVLEYKKRPEGKAISVAASTMEMARQYVEINDSARNLYRNFTPGPITIISKSKRKLDKRLESEKGSLGVRIPNYKISLDIISSFRKPITSTSANPIGKKTPYSIDDVLNNLSQKQKNLVDLIIDAGELPHNAPSSVVDTTTEELTIYRTGRIDPTKFAIFNSKVTNNEEETIKFGKDLITQILKQNIFKLSITILLNGELGAGKTHFVKGLAKGLGIDQIIKSPTYNYVNEYKVKNTNLITKLRHFDAWRIQSKEDLEALDFYNWFQEENIIIVEWPTVISNLDLLFFERLNNYFYIDFIILDENTREIRVYKKV